MTATPCELYATPTTVWPKQQFPSAHPAVSRLSQGQRLAAKRAWNYFEEVETKDAATRVRVGLAGGAFPATNLWCQFNGDGMRSLYEKGRQYHILICPEYDWTPQRNRGIPTAPLGSVLPEDCPYVGCSGETLALRSAPPEARALATKPRSNQLIREGIPTNPQDSRFETITLVSNTPQSPRSIGTPASPNPPGTPTSVGSPHPPGSPVSIKEPAPTLEVLELRLTPVPTDTIQLV